MDETGAGHRHAAVRVGEHACWAYGSDAERAAVATTWLAAGLDRGDRALYVGDGSVDALLEELADLPHRDEAVDDGALQVRSVEQLYDLRAPIDPAAQLALYERALDQAQAEGYTGLRVAADITSLLADTGRHGSHLHWEQVADRFMTERPLAPVCMYDARRLDDVDAIASVHPTQGPEPTPLAVYGGDPQTAVAAGEADAAVSPSFERILATLPGTDTTLDLGDLTFLDARAATVLRDALARRRDQSMPLVVVHVPAVVQRVWALLDFDADLLA